ncbi:hypothetical protein ACFXPE_22720 [Streptomyces scopuliridis]|uniref:hypothetical protein n=1 Tax=Streptomyces scopuliridis TaxID=452529 RepID=UPI0036A9172E
MGNDATEGGFLGDDAAESERRGESPYLSVPPVLTLGYESPEPGKQDDTEAAYASHARPPAQEGESSSAPVEAGATSVFPSPSQPPAQEATNAPAVARTPSTLESEVHEEHLTQPVPVLEEPTETHAPLKRSTAARRRNDGPGFTAASAEPALKPRGRKRAAGTRPPMQEAVLGSFITHRTERNWPTWSGRIEGETKERLLQKADDDAQSSGRNLMPGHYLDAALKSVKDLGPEELTALANKWLIEKWSGEHPPGVSIQAGVSPDMYQFLKGLKRTLRGQRGSGSGGLILDVVSAAVDRFLDAADEEGTFPPARQ